MLCFDHVIHALRACGLRFGMFMMESLVERCRSDLVWFWLVHFCLCFLNPGLVQVWIWFSSWFWFSSRFWFRSCLWFSSWFWIWFSSGFLFSSCLWFSLWIWFSSCFLVLTRFFSSPLTVCGQRLRRGLVPEAGGGGGGLLRHHLCHARGDRRRAGKSPQTRRPEENLQGGKKFPMLTSDLRPPTSLTLLSVYFLVPDMPTHRSFYFEKKTFWSLVGSLLQSMMGVLNPTSALRLRVNLPLHCQYPPLLGSPGKCSM